MIVLDVKPWDDETDMEQLKKNVLAIEMEGLTWGTHKLVPVGYGIKKLSVTMVVVDDLVSVDDVVDKITADEDHVQSVDVASFNKL
jgi:elongation factor 1-beta